MDTSVQYRLIVTIDLKLNEIISLKPVGTSCRTIDGRCALIASICVFSDGSFWREKVVNKDA